ADVPEQDRTTIWQGAAGLGNGSRRADRGGAGRDAQQRSAGAVSGRDTKGTLEPAGEAPAGKTLAGRARGREGQTVGRRRRTLCLRPKLRSGQQGTRDAAAAVEMAVEAAPANRHDGNLARRTADETRRRALQSPGRMASGRYRDRPAAPELHLRAQSQETANGQTSRRPLSLAHQSHRE